MKPTTELGPGLSNTGPDNSDDRSTAFSILREKRTIISPLCGDTRRRVGEIGRAILFWLIDSAASEKAW